MKKFAVISGFLGAGKTTAMMALTREYTARYGRAAMISNDLGHGVDLADDRYARLSGCSASQITGGCICYVKEELAGRLRECYGRGCELVMSDIPGFGVGALEHVYHGLSERFPGEFELAPFTVLAEPRTVELLRSGQGGDLAYLYRSQLAEADLIVLSKCDLLTQERCREDCAWLSEHFPEAEVLAVSAREGTGLGRLSAALREGRASMRRPDIGYGGEAFQNAMGRLSEFYIQYRAVVCCRDFDADAYLLDLARSVREQIRSAGFAIPHLKLLAWDADGNFGKADLIGTDRDIEVPHRFGSPCTDIAAVLNASAACPADRLEQIILHAVDTVSDRYQLERTVFKKESLAMGKGS